MIEAKVLGKKEPALAEGGSKDKKKSGSNAAAAAALPEEKSATKAGKQERESNGKDAHKPPKAAKGPNGAREAKGALEGKEARASATPSEPTKTPVPNGKRKHGEEGGEPTKGDKKKQKAR